MDTTKAYAYSYLGQIDLGNCTAKQIAYLLLEGVDVYAPNKMWKRINRHLNKIGVGRDINVNTIIDNETSELIDAWIEVWLYMYEEEVQANFDAFINQVNLSIEKEVEEFIEDMYLMGFLDGPESEEEE